MHISHQPHNILLIKPFTGDDEDCELSSIVEFLIRISEQKDVRPVMKSFLKHKGQRESENMENEIIPTVKREMNPRFLQKLQIGIAKTKEIKENDRSDQEDITTTQHSSIEQELTPRVSFRNLAFRPSVLSKPNVSDVESFKKLRLDLGSSLSKELNMRQDEECETPRKSFNPRPISSFLRT